MYPNEARNGVVVGVVDGGGKAEVPLREEGVCEGGAGVFIWSGRAWVALARAALVLPFWAATASREN